MAFCSARFVLALLFCDFATTFSVHVCGAPCRSGEPSKPVNWLDRHLGPPDIASVQELKALGPFVAPILYGGLGNVLFQLATVHVLAKQEQVPCVIGFFQHWNRAYNTFEPWGGHTPPAAGATLKDAFPAMRWLAVEPPVPGLRVFNRNAFKTVLPDEFHPLPDKSMMPFYLHGYFFNHKFWHPERAYLLKMLTFHPALQDYVTKMYGDLLDPAMADPTETVWCEPVSLHLRYGYKGEPAQNLLDDRKFPPLAFYDHVFSRTFTGAPVRYLVFSDDVGTATRFMRQQAAKHNLSYLVVDENVLVSTLLMSRCKHHVLTSSTLSFWGAYLDPKQPAGGKTILHESFFKDHGRGMMPDDYSPHWIVLDH
eukprot:TRINITY_DN9192_c0_g1_i1.p1 TRINITY_DN9192_c0_g1~~TRINITY_DN9192_c0_g1_i1.p1  ORF type:complete len:367 (+),score=71.13 TRINITY_DN9192_c0_g1_i1:101-1201(+)